MFMFSHCLKPFLHNITRSSRVNSRHWYRVSKPCYNNQRIEYGRFFSTHINNVQPQQTITYHRKCNRLLRPVCYQYQCKLFTSSDIGPDFTEVYRFPYIIQAKIISRFKIYQTIITTLTVPIFTFLHTNDLFTLSGCIKVYSICALAFVMLIFMSRYIQRIVGRIAINKSQTTVRLSHLTFWGKRKDEYIEVENFIPFSDMTGEEHFKGILHVKTYQNPKEHYILFVGKYGNIIDEESFVTIFGKIK